MKNISRIFIHSLLTLVVAALVACGGSSEKETSPAENMGSSMETDTAAAPGPKLNMNTASEDELRTIPNVGNRMVHEFEEYRPYVSIQQFRKEIGKYVDEDQVAAYEEYIYVPIHRNDSDTETLIQIPGLDANEAKELVAARPFESNQAFFDSLSSYISEEELATAKTYVGSE
jgi:DNA uptake protein ComE-like DNA-binding protein